MGPLGHPLALEASPAAQHHFARRRLWIAAPFFDGQDEALGGASGERFPLGLPMGDKFANRFFAENLSENGLDCFAFRRFCRFLGFLLFGGAFRRKGGI